MSAKAIERSLKNIRSELEFLRDEKFITPEQYQQVASVFSTLPSQSNSQSRPPVPSPEPEKKPIKTVYALYDWQGHESNDMSISKGDEIEVTEEVNKDWWRGKTGSKEGIFPSNFVSDSPRIEKQAGPHEYIAPPSGFDENKSYSAPHMEEKSFGPPSGGPPSGAPPSYYGQGAGGPPPGPPQQSYYGQGAPMQQYYQPPPQQGAPPFVQQAQPQQQQPQQESTMHKFGSRFGNAAIWGAGATLGSDLINSIF